MNRMIEIKINKPNLNGACVLHRKNIKSKKNLISTQHQSKSFSRLILENEKLILTEFLEHFSEKNTNSYFLQSKRERKLLLKSRIFHMGDFFQKDDMVSDFAPLKNLKIE
jgi:hypothetical protein